MSSILIFKFVMKKVYPAGHDLKKNSEFLDFSKHCLKTFVRVQTKPKQTFCKHKGWLNVSTALMPPAQRWADNQCYSRIPHVLTLIHQFEFETVGICGIKCCMLHTIFFCDFVIFFVENSRQYNFI